MTYEEALDILRPYHSERAESFKMDLAAAEYWNTSLTHTDLWILNKILTEEVPDVS